MSRPVGAMSDDHEQARAAGMNDILMKPIRTDGLSAALIRAHAVLTTDSPPAA